MRNRLGLLAVMLLTAWLAGCGGGPGTKVTVHVQTGRGAQAFPLAVAYRIADGEWEWLPPDKKASYGFYVPTGQKRYGVAVRCAIMGMMSLPTPVRVYELTTDDATDPVVLCPNGAPRPPRVGVAVHGDVSAVTGAQTFSAVSEIDRDHSSSNQEDVEPVMIKEPSRDLLLLAYSTNAFPYGPADLLAARVFRGIEPEEGLELSLSLTDADAVGAAQVEPVTLPAGWPAGDYQVALQTQGGRFDNYYELLGRGTTGGGTYRTVSGLTADDFYVFHADAQVSDPGGTRRSLAYSHWVPAAGAGDLEAGLPAAFAESYAPDLGGERASFGLSYPEAGSAVAFSFSVTSNDHVTTKAWVSPAWLAGAASYTMPDLTGVPGFSNAVTRSSEVALWKACAIQSSSQLGDLLARPHEEDLSPTVHPGAELDLETACIWNH